MTVEGTISQDWKKLFGNWPASLSRTGVLVTRFNEQIPFCEFLTSDAFLLVERRTPDALGARKVMLSYDGISALKITDVIKSDVFVAAGFSKQVVKKKA